MVLGKFKGVIDSKGGKNLWALTVLYPLWIHISSEFHLTKIFRNKP